jgi:adenylosuccinate synthase
MTTPTRRASVVVDLGFGDAGKGTLVDWLARSRRASLVVRWNGGAQAGHNVVLEDGRHHTFSQLGAGTFVPGVRTHLSEHVVVHPTALLVEARVLADKGVPDALERLSIAQSARVISPFHQAANRLREIARGNDRHGTCGVGVGEAVRDALEHPGDALRMHHVVGDPSALKTILRRVQERIRASLTHVMNEASCDPELAILDDGSVVERWVDAIEPLRRCGVVTPDDALATLWRDRSIVLEGAQGVLLDEQFGFHPHTTWSPCTPALASFLLGRHGWDGEIETIGVLRAYSTRHGPGPFPTEDLLLADALPEPHNGGDGWQGTFRRGWPDWVLARYARDACGSLDALAITHLDRLGGVPRWKAARAYESVDPDLATLDREGFCIGLRPGDLAHQERLSHALHQARPVYEAFPSDPDRFVERVEAELGIPVAVTSHGPMARDKRQRRGSG